MKLIDYLPPVLRGIGDFIEVTEAEQKQFDAFGAALDRALSDMFIETLTENGILRWEKMLGVVPKGTDTPDVRRFRILAMINEQAPYTLRSLEKKLTILCGKGNFRVFFRPADYTLIVRLSLPAGGVYSEAKALLLRMAPANLLADIALMTIWGEVKETEWGNVKTRTWEELRTGLMDA
ncbi:MAG: DUF2313 domain-containing protein [Bacillota bacterium]|nr:DUF2313 domain-containing protein [Bacillota bacterium]